MATIWPDEVPVLSAKDICRDKMNGDNGKHCLAGWVFETFNYHQPRCEPTAAAQSVFSALSDECGYRNITRFNDSMRNSKVTIANVWNRTMAKLGYVVGNPAAAQ